MVQELAPKDLSLSLLSGTKGVIVLEGLGAPEGRTVLPTASPSSPAEIREEELRLRLAVAGSNAGIWDWDLLDGSAFYSPIYRSLLGYAEEEPFGEEIAAFDARLHPDERKRIQDLVTAHLEQDAPYDYEFRLALRSGEYRWFRNRGRAFWDEEGRPVRMLGTIHEISDRRRMLNELAQRENTFRSLIETAASVIVGLRADHTIFEWNPEAERVFGYSREEAVGRSYFTLAVPEEERAPMEREFAAVWKGEAVRNLESRAVSRRGTASVLLWNISRLLDEGNSPMGVIMIGLDITERKLNEQELQQNRRLKAVGELAAGVAHEFNNMLTPMLVHVQGVADHLADRPELREELARVEHAIESAAALVSRIVQMSKPSADRLEPGRLSEVVEETVAFLGKTLDRRIQLRTRFEPEPGPALLSRSGIAQVLINLLINAKDAALERAELAPPDGWTPLIEIATRKVSGKDGRLFLQLSVSDNGAGMSEETRQRVFQPFFTTKGPRKGTGLGLAAVWSFVESMEGFIELQSREGHGTTFLIHLPWRPDSSGAEAAVPAAPAPPSRRDHRVLYVEDDDYVAGAILSFLSRPGLSVEREADGLAGLRAVLDRGPWDLVLTDLNMPNFSGLDLIRELRKRNYPGKVAVITGMLSREHEAELRALEIDTFLPKPVTPHALIEKVWELVNPAGGAWDI